MAAADISWPRGLKFVLKAESTGKGYLQKEHLASVLKSRDFPAAKLLYPGMRYINSFPIFTQAFGFNLLCLLFGLQQSCVIQLCTTEKRGPEADPC